MPEFLDPEESSEEDALEEFRSSLVNNDLTKEQETLLIGEAFEMMQEYFMFLTKRFGLQSATEILKNTVEQQCAVIRGFLAERISAEIQAQQSGINRQLAVDSAVRSFFLRTHMENLQNVAGLRFPPDTKIVYSDLMIWIKEPTQQFLVTVLPQGDINKAQHITEILASFLNAVVHHNAGKKE